MEIRVVSKSDLPFPLVYEKRERYRLDGGEDPPSAPWDDAEHLRWTVRHWAARLNVSAPEVQLRSMTTKWASISTRGRLTLNADLLDLPRLLGEYVVVHELVHLLVPDHGRVFKLFLDAYMPDWRERETVLRQFEGNDHAEKRGRCVSPPRLIRG